MAKEVVEKGFDHRYGARAVMRVIEKEVGGLLAARIMDGSLPEGVLHADALWTPVAQKT